MSNNYNLTPDEKGFLVGKIFDIFEINGLHAYDLKFVDGYFIFDMGKNSVCNFKIKGMRNWLFGVWITNSYCVDHNSYNKDAGETPPDKLFIFCEHVRYIDKFKPSATIHLCSVDLRTNSAPAVADIIHKAAHTVRIMKKNMLKTMYENYDDHYYRNNKYNIFKGLRFYFADKWYAFKKWWKDYVIENRCAGIAMKMLVRKAKRLGVSAEYEYRKNIWPHNIVTITYPSEWNTDDINSEEYDMLFNAYCKINNSWLARLDCSLRIENEFIKRDGTHERFYIPVKD